MSTKVTPVGNAPVSERDGVGRPVVVTENDPAAPNANVALAALVIAGPWSTVRVRVCVAGLPTPLVALTLRE